MNANEKRPRPGQGIEGAKCDASNNAIMPIPGATVNLDSPRLWRALRKFNRNFKRISRLQEENSALLGEMHRLQGVL